MTQSCPYCAESIAQDAIKCRCCGEWMPDAASIASHLVSQCPHCAELIRPTANKCQHCHEWLIASSSDSMMGIEPVALPSSIQPQVFRRHTSEPEPVTPEPEPEVVSSSKSEPDVNPEPPVASQPEPEIVSEPSVVVEDSAAEDKPDPVEVPAREDVSISVEKTENPSPKRPGTIPTDAKLPNDGFATMSQVFEQLEVVDAREKDGKESTDTPASEAGKSAYETSEEASNVSSKESADEASEELLAHTSEAVSEAVAFEMGAPVAAASTVPSKESLGSQTAMDIPPPTATTEDADESSSSASQDTIASMGEAPATEPGTSSASHDAIPSTEPPTAQQESQELDVGGDDVNDTMIGDSIAPEVMAKAEASRDSSSPSSDSIPTDSSETLDADLIFEEIMQDMTDDEFKMFEVLSMVRRKFWAPLRSTFQNLETRNLKKALQSLDLSPIRLSIRDLIQEVGTSLFDTYEKYVEDFAEQTGLPAEQKVYFMLEGKEREMLLGELRGPFREYIERLEHLDELCEGLLDEFDDLPASQRARLLTPLLSSSAKRRLDQNEEARGIESSWRTLHGAIGDFVGTQSILKEELNELLHGMEQFLSQLEPTYSAVLNRILEVWSDRLVAALQESGSN